MKKRLIIICLIVAGIFSAAVSDTMSIYTKSFNYNITLEDPRPLKPEEFYCYEIHQEPYPTGKVDFDVAGQKITLHDESGAMRTYTQNYHFEDYTVHAQILSSSGGYHNFGVSFNGSYLLTTPNARLDHYVMYITNDYKLQVRRQTVHNNKDGGQTHENDMYNTNASDINAPVPSVLLGSPYSDSIDVSQYLKGKSSTDPLNVQVKVSVTNEAKIDLYFYLDGHLINQIGEWKEVNQQGHAIVHDGPIPYRVGSDLRHYQAGGEGSITVGVNSYGKKEIVTKLLYMEQWDGKDFKYYES